MSERVKGLDEKGVISTHEFADHIVDTIREPLVILNADFTVRSANRSFYRTFQASEVETVGRSLFELGTGQWNIPELRRLLEQILPTKNPMEDFEVVHDFEHMGRKTMLLNARQVERLGEPPLILLAIEDFTQRRQAEDAVKEAARRKDQFVSMLAHELRNPLAPLRNALHVLKLRSDDPAAVNRVGAMLTRQVEHMGRLIDDLLDVTRITQGKIRLQLERTDLARLVRTNATDFEPLFTAAGITLGLDIPDNPVWVSADSARLVQVLNNLLSNALKFTDRGGWVVVRVLRTPKEALLSVTDDGIGIEPHVLPIIFETFEQADRSLDRSRGGLGLGLSLVKGLTELHGGTIEAKSEGLGKGSEFMIRLKLEQEPDAVVPARIDPKRLNRSLRVLVVEDHKDAAESLRMILELFGCEVAVTFNGWEGVQATKRFRPDVIFCDIGLPGMDGYEVAQTLRESPESSEVKLVAITGYGDPEGRQKALAAGFNEHFTKPVNPAVIENILSEVGRLPSTSQH
jgi:two-component system, chemotaxis family, CheB/CheR fusion protein